MGKIIKMGVEGHNLKEEIKEIVDRALEIGISNKNSAVFRIMREEQYSPEGMARMLQEGHYERVVYDCNLSKSSDFGGLRLSEAFLKARRILVLEKKEISSVKAIIENLTNTGNPYGIKDG